MAKKEKIKEDANAPQVESKESMNFLWMLFGIGFLWLLFYYWFDVYARKRTFTKASLRKPYKVDDETFNKWVFYFCYTNVADYNYYLSKRKFNYYEHGHIIECLGEPTEETAVMTKGEIAGVEKDINDNVYRGVRNSMRKAKPISYEAYHKLNVFPPKISKMLYGHF